VQVGKERKRDWEGGKRREGKVKGVVPHPKQKSGSATAKHDAVSNDSRDFPWCIDVRVLWITSECMLPVDDAGSGLRRGSLVIDLAAIKPPVSILQPVIIR